MDRIVAQKLDKFFAAYQTRHYRKGQVLVHAHDNPGYVFHLIKGNVKQYDISYRGDEVLLNTFKPPAFFPMSYAINKTSNHYFFEAETEVDLHLAPISDTVQMLKDNPDVLFDLLSRVFNGVDGLLGRISHLMAGSARSRVLYELLIQCQRFGNVNGWDVTVSLTEADIGARAGLARETVSREIRKLKEEGIISVVKKEITVYDLDRLAASVGREV